MLTHRQIWAAIDALALRFDLSVSGLAKKAGLDATTFNKSKRLTGDGKERWPTTESLSKILVATQTSLDEFIRLMPYEEGQDSNPGFGEEEQKAILPDSFLTGGPNDYLYLQDFEDYMEPLYRAGDQLIVSIREKFKEGDRIVVKLNDGRVIPGIFKKKDKSGVKISALNIEVESLDFSHDDIDWLAKIFWVSQ